MRSWTLAMLAVLGGCGGEPAADTNPSVVLNADEVHAAVDGSSAPVSPEAANVGNQAAIAAMKKQLLAEPKIRDVLYQGKPQVSWQVSVADDGGSRIGFAGYVCLKLSEKGLVDGETDVRVVDAARLAASPGDFRGASLGHIRCIDEQDLGT